MQISHAIAERRKREDESRLKALEWQTQILAQFIACTAPDGKQQKTLLSQASKIRITASEEDDEETKQEPGENVPGSFEALMSGFGG